MGGGDLAPVLVEDKWW